MPASDGPPPPRLEERYRTVLDSMDDAFCVIEVLFDATTRAHDYRFLEINPAFVRHTGLADAVGRSMRALAPAHEEHWFELYGRVARTGEPTRFIQRAEALEDRWYEVYAFRIDAPELRHVAILFRDISARIAAERSARVLSDLSRDLLRTSREEDLAPAIGPALAAHLGLSQCAFVEIDPAGGVATVRHCWQRPGFASLAGTYPLDDLTRDGAWRRVLAGEIVVIRDVHHDERISRPAEFARRAIGSFVSIPPQRANSWNHAFIVYRPHPSQWDDRDIALAREVAERCWARIERLRAEAALRASNEHLRLIIENAREYAIFAADRERRVTSWNAGAERLLGYTEAEILGCSADIIFTPEDRQRSAPEKESTQALREGRAANERWHLRKDGSRFWGSGAMMAMHDATGAIYGLLKIMRDQTEAQHVRQALEESQRDALAALQATEQARADAVAAGRAKDQFFAALSHELRTPLNPVLMISSEAANDASLPPEIRADFEIVRKNIELEARLIDDMLDLTRIAQGKLPLQEIEVDLHGIVRAALEVVRPAAADKGIALPAELLATRTHVRGDPARLQQVFINLLNNAVKFTPARGRVTVGTRNPEQGTEVWVRVTDTGIGMTREELARVFLPFAQGSHAGESGSPTYGGLGLGLAIADELAVRHGGRIVASSPGPGHGATFTVILPTVGAPAAPAPALLPSAKATRALRILLVEDHGHTRVAIARILARRGHVIEAAGTKADALAAAARSPFDLLISDIGLPDGDGYELMAELRRQNPQLQGVALSGFGMENDLRRSASAGFVAHLVKPISVAKLDAVIAQLAEAPGPSPTSL